MSTKISGIVPPLVTPLLDRDELDVDGTGRLVRHLIDGGVGGLFVLGTTGEGPSLSYRLRREFIQTVCEIAEGRVPVMVGITDTSFVESVNLAKSAADSGAHSLVLSTPYYFPAGQTELTQYVKRLVPELPLPVMLYNMPSLTKVWFEIETLQTLSPIQQIIGVKDSGGDLEYYAKVCELKKLRPDWSILIGPEELMAESIKLGGDGGVNGGANVFPQLFVDCYNAAVAGDEANVAKLNEQINRFGEIYAIGKYASRIIKAIKCAASIQEICSDRLAEPFTHFLPPERERVREILASLDPDLAR